MWKVFLLLFIVMCFPITKSLCDMNYLCFKFENFKCTNHIDL
jgi:hypothetical protein